MDKYPEITFAIENEFKKLISEKLTPWVFLNTGKMAPVKGFSGNTIQYRGVTFEGSPREVFWGGFIEPFMEASFVWAFEFALDYIEKRNHDRRDVILYTHQCLTNGFYVVYKRMQEIDRNLRGKGFPNQVTPQDISIKVQKMENRLNEYRDSALVASRLKSEPAVDAAFSDAIEIKPKIFGISLDLKKFYKWCKSKFSYS